MADFIRRLTNRALAQLGYRITRCIDEPIHPFEVLPLVVQGHLRHAGDCFVVQIGANDGLTSDPVHRLIVQHRLKGLLVEPVPYLFRRLTETYAGHEGVTLRNCAIGSQDGPMTFFALRPDNPFPAWAQGLAGTSRDHIRQFGLPRVDDYITQLTVPGVTVQTLLQPYSNEPIGLMQIDTEGYDAEILRQVLDSPYRPAIINYEHKHLSKVDRIDCKRKLAEAGYRFIDVQRDTLAVLFSRGLSAE